MNLSKIVTRKNIIFFLLGLFLSFLFFAWTLVVKTDTLHQFDFNTTVRLQNHVPLRLDPYFSFLSLIGSFEIIFPVLLIFVLLRKKFLGILVTVFLFGFAHVTEIIGKSMLHQPPPPFMFHRYDISFLFPSSYVQPGSSYPSGHALRITFLGVVLTYFLFWSKKLSPPIKSLLFAGILTVVILMLVSRVSLGEHWTTDVIGGSILGTSFGLLSLIFL